MNNLGILDLAEGTDSARAKAAKLAKSNAVALFLPRITELRGELDAYTGKDPTKLTAAYRDELAEVDARHDGYGRALHLLLGFYETHPDAKPAQRKAVAQVRPVFLPSLDELMASYETEANEARRRRPLLAKHKDALKALPYGPKGTAYGLVEKMLATGDELSALLQKRADAEAKNLPIDTRRLLRSRSLLVNALSSFRDALGAEVGRNGVTAEAIADVFARLDGQSTTREGAASRKRAAAKKATAKRDAEGKDGDKKAPKA